MGGSHWGDSGRGCFDLHSIGDFLNGNWFGGVDVGDGVGNRGNSSLPGSNWGDINIGGRDQVRNGAGNGSSHDSLASEVNQSILVSALRSKGAKDLWGLHCVPEGRSEGPTGRLELPWVVGAARQDKKNFIVTARVGNPSGASSGGR